MMLNDVVPLVLPAAQSIMPIDKTENMAVSLALAGLAFAITLIIGRPYITFLRMRKYGKKIRLELQDTMAKGKAGTPTMGGVMFVVSTVLITLVFNTYGRLSMLLPIGVLISAGVLGIFDDRMSLEGDTRNGMSGRFKFAFLTIFGVIAALILYLPDPFGLGLRHIYVPFFDKYEIGWLYVPIAAFAIIGSANAQSASRPVRRTSFQLKRCSIGRS